MIAHGKKIKIFTGNSHPELAKEIADLLGISLNTVKDHVKKAYAFLREELRREVSFPVLFFALYFKGKVYLNK